MQVSNKIEKNKNKKVLRRSCGNTCEAQGKSKTHFTTEAQRHREENAREFIRASGINEAQRFENTTETHCNVS
jgi:hypothetical protein